jgi:hypothetical protein
MRLPRDISLDECGHGGLFARICRWLFAAMQVGKRNSCGVLSAVDKTLCENFLKLL